MQSFRHRKHQQSPPFRPRKDGAPGYGATGDCTGFADDPGWEEQISESVDGSLDFGIEGSALPGGRCTPTWLCEVFSVFQGIGQGIGNFFASGGNGGSGNAAPDEWLLTSGSTGTGAGSPGGLQRLQTAANELSTAKLDKTNCQTDLTKLGTNANNVRQGAGAAIISNGVGSDYPVASLFAGASTPAVRAQGMADLHTVGSIFMLNPNVIAQAALGAPLIFVAPDRIGTVGNLPLAMHEVLHNVTGLDDREIQTALGLKPSGVTDNINVKLQGDCF